MALQGVVDLSRVHGYSTLIGRRFKDDFSDEGFVFSLVQGDHVVKVSPCDSMWGSGDAESARRVRVWAPRLAQMAWVWQAATDGTPMIQWKPDCTGIQSSQRSTGFLSRALSVVSRVHARTPSSDLSADGNAPLDLFVDSREGVIPETLMLQVVEALDFFSAEGQNATAGSEASILFAQSAQQRDPVWRDLIDPELCLTTRLHTSGSSESNAEFADTAAGFDWQSADAHIDQHGKLQWLSWVNHIEGGRHGALLAGLAQLLELALPQLQVVSGHRLKPRQIQVVVRAYDQVLAGDGPLYKIAEWHTDGHPRERIIATAACYVCIEGGLMGGAVDFASGADAWVDDPEKMKTVLPKQGAVLAFNNAMLRHRVGHLGGIGRRRMVAFHLVDPEHHQNPAAMCLPRQLRSQARLDMLRTLARLDLPSRCKVLIVQFAVVGSTAQELLHRRDRERYRRSRPARRAHDREHMRRRTTTIHLLTDFQDMSEESSQDGEAGRWHRIALG